MTKRFLLFVLVAALLLPVGSVGAQMGWQFFHHRYEHPETGFYHGSVYAFCDSSEELFYLLHFKAKTSPRWYWRQPTNFTYSTLEVVCRGDSSERQATVSLPDFTYSSGGVSAPFTRDVLAGWLLGSETNQADARQHADALFGYFQAAADGSLPHPRHHAHRFEQPTRVRIQHFLLGYGVGSTVYIWVAVWLFWVVIVGRKMWRRSPESLAHSKPGSRTGTTRLKSDRMTG
jgi:hypothetical protein